ncbi:hypothetical protein PR003_g23175 [Phytophthora rubi]|uniref:Chromo domain-containing protein n=1 Tax=Phytophthora rubi TaxID=129364 RepID=A0A6A4CYZ6_9STRA|nr:hypothetical protein PR002_g25647 [Phytophthora rubi]KAE9298668.1 hypothetical protein PR003_g23175 [Phytophthora rubi]
MVDASETRRRAARAQHERRQGVKLHKFSEADFVQAGTATDRSGRKLALVWRGPKKLVRALNDYTFQVQDIVAASKVSIRDASRLQLYRDAAGSSVEELQQQAIFGEGGHLVEVLRACRLSPDTHRWEILVKWFGLDVIEASWEQAEVIKQDVPLLFEAVVTAAQGGGGRSWRASSRRCSQQSATIGCPPLDACPAIVPLAHVRPFTRCNRSGLEGEVICPGAVIQHRQLEVQSTDSCEPVTA